MAGRPAPERRLNPIADVDDVTPTAQQNADKLNELLVELRNKGYLRSS